MRNAAEPLRHEIKNLPDGGEFFANIADKIGRGTVALFLDFDGTLAPIAAHPTKVALSLRMRERVKALAPLCHVAIISGRDRLDVQAQMGIPGIIYAGGHGFDLADERGMPLKDLAHHKEMISPHIFSDIEQSLARQLSNVPGVWFEPKRFSLAVHFRDAVTADYHRINEAVSALLVTHPQLRRMEGKKVIELQPSMAWDKGAAVTYLLDHWKVADATSLYLGDDVTDEDAFRVLAREKGIPILVNEGGEGSTFAQYVLAGVEEVELFLGQLAGFLKERHL